MRLFFIGWGGGRNPELVDIVKGIKKGGHQIAYWSCTNQELIDKSIFSETVFHDLYDALTGKPAPGIDDAIFTPPSESLLKQLYETESIVLTMMNKKYSRLSIGERKHFYYDLLKYWNGVIRKLNPDTIIFSTSPHTVYDFVIYSLAQLLKIKTVMFSFTWVSDRIMIVNDYVQGNIDLQKAFLNNKINFLLSDLSVDVQEYYHKFSEQFTDTIPQYVKRQINTYRGLNKIFINLGIIYESIVDLSIFKKGYLYLVKKVGANLKREYTILQTQPDFSGKFVYVPLAFQPESSTSPNGGIFVDQILMIEILSASLPADWLVYVKEHPVQWARTGLGYNDSRYKGYYKKIAQLKNVRIIPIETQPRFLIKNAQAVVIVTGTTGWESAMKFKPVLVFGFPWYQHCPAVFKVNNVISCKDAITKIVNGFSVSKQQMINYLALLEKFSIQGYEDDISKTVSNSKLSTQENINNYLGALISEIEKRNL